MASVHHGPRQNLCILSTRGGRLLSQPSDVRLWALQKEKSILLKSSAAISNNVSLNRTQINFILKLCELYCKKKHYFKKLFFSAQVFVLFFSVYLRRITQKSVLSVITQQYNKKHDVLCHRGISVHQSIRKISYLKQNVHLDSICYSKETPRAF